MVATVAKSGSLARLPQQRGGQPRARAGRDVPCARHGQVRGRRDDEAHEPRTARAHALPHPAQQHQKHGRKRHVEAVLLDVADRRADGRAERRHRDPREVKPGAHARVIRDADVRGRARARIGERHRPAFVAHEEQRGERAATREAPQVGRERRAHQDVARIHEERHRDDQRDVRRRRPQMDRRELGAAAEVQARHHRHLEQAEPLLRGLCAEHQRERHETQHDGQRRAQPATHLGDMDGLVAKPGRR
jgi:hypothetical protein